MELPMTKSGHVLRLAGWCLAATLAAGCGYEEYNTRLAETAKYFAYQERMNANLAAPMRELPIEEIRMPLQFAALPKPKPPAKREDGSEEETPFDPRQPNYANITLPGLIAAWQAPVETLVDGKPENRPGYIYALSNYWMFVTGHTEQAPLFTRDTRRLVAAAFGTVITDPDGVGDRETYPRAAQYTTPVAYDVTRFNPEMLINDVRYTVELFSHQQGDIQLILMVVVPRDADLQRTRLNERIPLMLETLKLSNKKPSAPPKKGAATAAPPAAPTGF